MPTTAASVVDALTTTALSSLPAAVPASKSTETIEPKAQRKKLAKAKAHRKKLAKAKHRRKKLAKAKARRKKLAKAKHRRKKLAKAKAKRRRRARRGFVQLESSGPGFVTRNLRHSWGKELTIRRLKEASAAYAKRFPQAPPMHICDLSRRRGGRFHPHVSHRTGRDVDIGLILKRPRKTWVKASGKTLHAERMWFFVSSLVATGDVQYVFLDRRLQRAMYRLARSRGVSKEELARVLQYPRRHGGIVRHWKGHRDHMHVRFVRSSRKLRQIPLS